MNLSDRLSCIARFLPACECLADIGTDHGYIPIEAISQGICKHGIASDIRKGPIAVARKNIALYKLEDKIETRVGPGLTTLKKGEADVILVAGMGGNMIAEIIEECSEIASEAMLILQPVQYPEELRKYLFDNKYDILDEELSKEGNKFYHIIKAKKTSTFNPLNYQEYKKGVYFYTGIQLVKKNHPLIKTYVEFKLKRLSHILKELSNSGNEDRRNEVLQLKGEFEEVRLCLEAATRS